MISLIECHTGHRSRDLFLRILADLPIVALLFEGVGVEGGGGGEREEREERLLRADSLKAGLNLTDSYSLLHFLQLLAKFEVILLFVVLENGSFIHQHYSPQKWFVQT